MTVIRSTLGGCMSKPDTHVMDDDVRTALKAIQWERTKGEMRAFAALAGSYNSTSKMSEKWIRINKDIENFIKLFEDRGLHE